MYSKGIKLFIVLQEHFYSMLREVQSPREQLCSMPTIKSLYHNSMLQADEVVDDIDCYLWEN